MRKHIKLTRKTKVVINILLILLLALILGTVFQVNLLPQQAMRDEEKNIGFGPSEIAGSVKQENISIVFGNCGQWTLCSIEERIGGFLWKPAGLQSVYDREKQTGDFGFRIKESKPLYETKTGETYEMQGILYGLISNPQITRIEAEFTDGRTEKAQMLDKGIFYIPKISGEYTESETLDCLNEEYAVGENLYDGPCPEIQWKIKAVAGYDKDGNVVRRVEDYHKGREALVAME